MGGVRLGAATVAVSALATFVFAPAALALPGAKPSPGTKKTAAAKPTAHPTAKKTAPPAIPTPPPTPCNTPPSYPASRLQGIPWAQQRLDFTDVWGITKGKGVTVAVVDSGINQSHPQLAGRVTKSIDLTGTHNTDCYGHGTEVAGIIAGKDERNGAHPIPFVGVAPEAKLISIKVQDQETSTDGGALLARGIMRAVEAGADIINVSAYNTDYPLLRKAVREAADKHVLIVASAGNTDPQKKASEQEAFPASYPTVLSVGAVGPSGPVSGFSNTTSKVDVTAPGESIISTCGDGYVGDLQGTSFSAPYVTGVAALIKASKPSLTDQQIKQRIIATADGSIGDGSGEGVVDPHAAVTDLVSGSTSPKTTQVEAQPIDIGGPAPVDHHTRDLGALIAAGTIGAALLVVFGGVVVPLGRRRGWRPGRAVPPGDGPPEP